MTRTAEQDGQGRGDLFFKAYLDDPLAVFVLSRQSSEASRPEPWSSWKYPIIITAIEAAFFGLAVLIYLIRDGALYVEKWGGYPVLISVIVFDLVAFLLGARIYLYFSWKSGDIFQALADKKVIDESLEDAKRIVNRSAESKVQRYKWVVVLWGRMAIVDTKPFKLSLSHKAESSSMLSFWIPAFAGMTAYVAVFHTLSGWS